MAETIRVIKAWITTFDGIDFMAEGRHFENKDGIKMTRCICNTRAETKERLIRTGLLSKADIRPDGSFIKDYPSVHFNQLGLLSRYVLSLNFDGSEAKLGQLWGLEKNKYILTLEQEVKFWKGMAAINLEGKIKAGLGLGEEIKDMMKKASPVGDFIKKYRPFYMPPRGSSYRPVRMSPATMPSEEEEYIE